jgi:hypothetical protein
VPKTQKWRKLVNFVVAGSGTKLWGAHDVYYKMLATSGMLLEERAATAWWAPGPRKTLGRGAGIAESAARRHHSLTAWQERWEARPDTGSWCRYCVCPRVTRNDP